MMQCPRCGVALSERTRAGVVVDACSRCRGVWLDRGELEMLVAEFHTYGRETRRWRIEAPSLNNAAVPGGRRASTWSRLMQLFH